MIGMSQDKLGQAIGLTFQQIQKYEKGTNRIGASRLYQFATVLNVPPGWFFEGLEGQPVEARNGTLLEAAPQDATPLTTFSREDIELLRAFQSVGNPMLRRRVMELVRAMAAGAGEEEAA